MVLVDRQSWIGTGGKGHSRAIQLQREWNLGWEDRRSSNGWGLGRKMVFDWIDLLDLVVEEFEQLDLFGGEDRVDDPVENDHYRVCELQVVVVPLRLFVSAPERLHRLETPEVQVQSWFPGIYSVPS